MNAWSRLWVHGGRATPSLSGTSGARRDGALPGMRPGSVASCILGPGGVYQRPKAWVKLRKVPRLCMWTVEAGAFGPAARGPLARASLDRSQAGFRSGSVRGASAGTPRRCDRFVQLRFRRRLTIQMPADMVRSCDPTRPKTICLAVRRERRRRSRCSPDLGQSTGRPTVASECRVVEVIRAVAALDDERQVAVCVGRDVADRGADSARPSGRGHPPARPGRALVVGPGQVEGRLESGPRPVGRVAERVGR